MWCYLWLVGYILLDSHLDIGSARNPMGFSPLLSVLWKCMPAALHVAWDRFLLIQSVLSRSSAENRRPSLHFLVLFNNVEVGGRGTSGVVWLLSPKGHPQMVLFFQALVGYSWKGQVPHQWSYPVWSWSGAEIVILLIQVYNKFLAVEWLGGSSCLKVLSTTLAVTNHCIYSNVCLNF